MKRSAILGMIALLLAAACTVKEDRTYCPALCVVYSDGYLAEGCGGELCYNLVAEQEGVLGYGTGSLSSFTERGKLVFEVPRNENVYVDVFCGQLSMTIGDSALRIPLGCCCDKIYSGHGRVVITGEEGEAGLPLHKDFAQLKLELLLEGEDNPFFLRILGNVDGYVLPGGLPHKGEFDYRPVEGKDRSFTAIVPRQYDESLILEICHRSDGMPVERYPLGQMIGDKGYDWKQPDLEDLEIFLSFGELGFEIEISPWEESGTINLTI